jgi:hypothetical protein
MPGQDHVVIEAAVRAKRAQQQKAATSPPPTASIVNKAVTAGIWVAAAGSLAAVMLAG